MKAIFKREFKSYFQNIIGWLYLAATIALYGLYFFVYNLNYGSSKVSYSLNAITFLFLITVPILTMRSLAEEQKSKTDQLILTSPVSVGKIITAKYLAMAAIHTIAVLVIGLTPLLLLCFGKVPLGEAYVAVAGFYLYGLTCIAIGLFVSSLTESQVISAVMTFVFLFLGYMMNGITSTFSASGNILTKILNCYDLVSPLDSFMDGCFSITGVIYYVTVTVLFLFLASQSVQKRRFTVSAKKLKLGVFSLGFVAIAVALTVVVNLFAAELPSTYMELDATSTKLYSLTDDTKKMLQDMDKDVTIYVIAAEKSADKTVAETLKRYEDSTSHVKVEYKDPTTNPTFYQQYTSDTISMGSLIVTCGDTSKVIDSQDLYETSIDYNTYSQQTTGYDGEGQITSALQYVTNDNRPVIYQITGHGEAELTSNFKKAVEKANATLETVNLLEKDEIPSDAQAVIINGPTSDFSKDDADKVITYMQGGGNVLVAANYQSQADLSNFESILAEYDISLVNGIVAEGNSDMYYQNPFYLLPEVASNTYTASVGSNYIFAPYVQGISYPESTDDVTYTALLTTSEDAVSKTDAANATTYAYEDGDEKGPFTVALAAEKTIDDDTTGKLVVLGSTELIADNADQMVSGSNSAMFADMLSNFINTDGMVTTVIPVKSYEASQLTISAFTAMLTGIAVMIVLPLLLLIAGIVIWAKRRKR